ncbi:MAG: prolipoprotein diacylglyceryl transferase [Nitrospinae bacterium]|nr:prolipoprotein diacylglyceryl transferase [Nitrospinota bacterium]
MYPALFIGPLTVSTWRLTVLLAVILTWVLLLRRTGRLGYNGRDIFYWVLSGLVVGFVGGQTFNVLIPYLAGGQDAETREVLSSGMTVIGSIVLCIVYSLLYLKYFLKLDPWPVLDAVAFSLPLPLFFGRIGCLLNGCCYGRLSPDWARGTPLSLFTLRKDAFAQNTFADIHMPNVPGNALLWNFPMMDAANALFILVLAESLFRNRERWRLGNGAVFSITVTMYAFSRFFLEFFREDKPVSWAPLNPWQVALAALFIVFLVVTLGRVRTFDKNPSGR